MDGIAAASVLLPPEYRAALEILPERKRRILSEIHLRLGRFPTILAGEREEPLPVGQRVEQSTLERVTELASGASPYAVEECMEQGYLCAPGGVRVGLCGAMRPAASGRWTSGNLTSLTIRIPREIPGCADGLWTEPFISTLILSPPGGGKTTLLRDMVRQVSDRGIRVSLCDERGEVAAYRNGKFGFDTGACTDVMTFCPRHKAAMIMLRLMDPQILAMDEITAEEDTAACCRAANCGVKLLATAHGKDAAELHRRPIYAPLLKERVFDRIIVIGWEHGKRIYREERLL